MNHVSPLEKLIRNGEGVTIEFKRTIESAEKIAKTLVAFANTSGGTLLIGIADDGSVVGVTSEQSEIAKIEAASDAFCDPPLTVSYSEEWYDGKTVLCITVSESDEKPHRVRDKNGDTTVYVRANDQSVPAGKTTLFYLSRPYAPLNQDWLQSNPVKAVLTYLRNRGSVTEKQLSDEMNLSQRRARQLLNELTQQGVVLIHDVQSPAYYTLRYLPDV